MRKQMSLSRFNFIILLVNYSQSKFTGVNVVIDVLSSGFVLTALLHCVFFNITVLNSLYLVMYTLPIFFLYLAH